MFQNGPLKTSKAPYWQWFKISSFKTITPSKRKSLSTLILSRSLYPPNKQLIFTFFQEHSSHSCINKAGSFDIGPHIQILVWVSRYEFRCPVVWILNEVSRHLDVSSGIQILVQMSRYWSEYLGINSGIEIVVKVSRYELRHLDIWILALEPFKPAHGNIFLLF